MRRYKASGTVTLHSGQVELTEGQYKRRRMSVEETKQKGVYRIADGAQVQFKAGEEFGYDGDIPKVWFTVVDALDGEPLGTRKSTSVNAPKARPPLRGKKKKKAESA